MMDEGDGMPGGGPDRIAVTEEINLVVCVDASLDMQCQVEIEQAGIGARMQDGALFSLSFSAGVVRGQVGGAAGGAVLAG